MPEFKTAPQVDLQRFMGKWYVITGRTTFLEEGAHNAVEIYTWNEQKKQIDIDFTFRQDNFTGKKKALPQTGWVVNNGINSHWKIQPFWPLKFDYHIIAVDPDYQWTAIGVPNQKYLWIMARTPNVSSAELAKILGIVAAQGYNIKNLQSVPQQH